jgi:hypothetical protein
MSEELLCLFYAVRVRFFELPLDKYISAMQELAIIANQANVTINDLAQEIQKDV